MKYGVTRNGEHLKLFEEKAQAEQYIEQEKARDQASAKIGWSSQRSADETRYHIEKVKRMPW